MTDELMIRRAPGACCPDCNIIGGKCDEMHQFILKEAISEKEKEFEDFLFKVALLPDNDAHHEIVKKLLELKSKAGKGEAE